VKIDNFAGRAPESEIDRPTTNRAVFDQRLHGLRRIDLDREHFAAVRTGNFGSDY
jgi:hypothetical protein